MIEFRQVPNELREREPPKRGREPKNKLSRALLSGNGTFFVEGTRRTWGSIYTLAKNHGKVAHVKRTVLNSVDGTLIWFTDREEDSGNS